MKIEQLIQVVEIAKTKSITMAAKNLYMSQSNLSISIRELEKELNKQIFIRSNNGTKITEFGEKLVEQAAILVKQFEDIKNMSEDLRMQNVKFGISSYYFLFTTYIAEEFFHNHRGIQMVLNLRECSRSDLIENVVDGESEIGILSVPSTIKYQLEATLQKKGLEYHCITEEPAIILVGKNSPLHDADIVEMKELEGYPILDFSEKDQEFLSLSENHLDQLHPDTLLYVSDRTSLLHFLNTTDCYHIATKNLKAYQTYLFHDQLKAILLKDSPFSIEIGWIKKKKEHLSEFGKEFLIRVQESLVLENLKNME
ncbi:LysR family transcriptional regulator [Anaerotignum sp.]|uniref:LysR family transcriptional regulator n=1 Tax=Anaerotignum sp. TaxID=2039241 RepID=UPI002A91E440|nr:LysR family transcriptional regulator [Anaerotignum sp.]MCI7658429.1 LysR family transcriptional regulator [Clostridia bacterium]MDY5415627.1 LysR family transcriptional regulator [Anaerotignum sp.]